ncbi:hypothetical protein L3X38_004334 [Prunus dulcis]|uniref:Uncharacterized protein n=1 Tax=Prunus dulcis TaxID=3755 RepID=A0AAD4ZNQ3_PRUDU|nr:hypothetical protein L3X38_004334 [Prunus dulcis]
MTGPDPNSPLKSERNPVRDRHLSLLFNPQIRLVRTSIYTQPNFQHAYIYIQSTVKYEPRGNIRASIQVNLQEEHLEGQGPYTLQEAETALWWLSDARLRPGGPKHLKGLSDTKLTRAANWQDSGDRSQPDPYSWLSWSGHP